jgi:PKD repeat protein
MAGLLQMIRSVSGGVFLGEFLILLFILGIPVAAYTTEVTITRMSADGITPTDFVVTKTYQEMEAEFPVMGNGNDYYYYQGPIFEGEWEANYGITYPEYRTDWGGTPPAWEASEERWDRFWNGAENIQNEEVNWQTKNLGKLKGTDVKNLVNLVGGVPEGRTARVIAVDNANQEIPYAAIYEPDPRLGPYVITWWSVDAGESGSTSGYTGPDYTNGMRATFFSDTSGNPSGEHVAGLGDQAAGLPEDYWYYYGGVYPSMGGWTVKYVDRINVYSNDPVPMPVADFFANIRTGFIQNGNFETGSLSPWTGSGATVGSSWTPKKDTYSVRLIAPSSGIASISQDIDLTTVGSLNFWRQQYGGPGKYMQVLIDDTLIANYTETVNVPNDDESIDVSSFDFSGTHTVTFNAVNTNPTGIFTVYLDNIEDYGPGTSGSAPLSIQFTDLSTKMEDSAHTAWAWDFNNDGTTDSTIRNPLYTYTENGIYTVKLTATNAGGSDTETKTDYIIVGTVEPPVAGFTATPMAGAVPLEVTFTDTSTNSPASWVWEYRNPTTDWTGFATTQNPTFAFTRGTYDIRLTATNPAGSDTTTVAGLISATPSAGFTAEAENVVDGGFETGSTGWTFTGATRDGTVTRTGSYSAEFSVTKNVPSPCSVEQSIDLTNAGQLSYYYQISDVNSGSLDIYIDSTKVAGHTAVAGWTQGIIDVSSYPGTHTFRAVAWSGTANKNKITAYLDDISVPALYPDGISGPAPLTVHFIDTSLNSPAGWEWDFDNNGVTDSTLQSPSYTYNADGYYTVKLTSTYPGGTDTETKAGFVIVGGSSPPPVAAFSGTPLSGAAPLTVTFTDESTNTPTSWAWDFGDGGTSNAQNPSHDYTAAGTYTVTLTATNSAGSDIEEKTAYITVTGTAPPVAAFSATPFSGAVPLSVTFTDESTNSPTSWSWTFGDGGTSTEQNPSHTYNAAGTYTVSLTATNAGGSDGETKSGYITASTPYIDISITGSIADWNFETGTNEDTGSVDMTVDTNMPEWAVSVSDALDDGKPPGTAGRMAEWSAGSGYIAAGQYLTNALKIRSGTGSYVTLSESAQTLQAGTSQGTLPFDIGIQQDISATDPALDAGNQYHIVITFTGGAA